MRVVAALGGNALLRRGEPLDAALQQENVRRAVAALVPVAHGHELVVTHGNGPQVGLLALQSAALAGAPTPLDVLGAESEGMIGYVLEQELGNALPGRDVATLLTRVVVEADDPAFSASDQADRPRLRRGGGAGARRRAGLERSPPTAQAGAASSPRPSRCTSSSSARSPCSWTRAFSSSAPGAAASPSSKARPAPCTGSRR